MLGTRLLEREAKSPAICNGFDMLYYYRLSAILDNFGHKITVFTKCNLSSHVDLLSKVIRSTIKSLSDGGSGGSERLPNSVLQAVGKPRRFVINSQLQPVVENSLIHRGQLVPHGGASQVFRR